MRVLKFGGTSLAGAERVRSAARIVAAHRREQPVVCVVSAMAGVTDQLLHISDLALRGDPAWHSLLAELRLRHQHALAELTANTSTAGASAARFAAAWAALEAALRRLLTLPAGREEARKHAIAAFSAWGERLSVLLMGVALAAEHLAVLSFEDAPVIMIEQPEASKAAENGHASQQPRVPQQLIASVEATRAWLAPRVQGFLHAGSVVIAPGYLARTHQGLLTTLGRNGSDHSAAIIGAALHASAVYIYSDVPGIYRADPRIVPEAALLPALTYAEAATIASLGAKVLHPASLRPLAAQNIPLRLRSALSPEAPGTTIGPADRSEQARAAHEPWIVAARPLTPERGRHVMSDNWKPGLVEITGALLQQAQWEMRENESSLAERLAGGVANDLPGTCLVSGALALLSAETRPSWLVLAPRHIRVIVPAAESAATQRRLYAALARGSLQATDQQRTMLPAG
jgi:aspartate kinase